MFEKQNSCWQNRSMATDWCCDHKKFTQIAKHWRTDHRKHNKMKKQRSSSELAAESHVSTVYSLNVKHTVEVILWCNEKMKKKCDDDDKKKNAMHLKWSLCYKYEKKLTRTKIDENTTAKHLLKRVLWKKRKTMKQKVVILYVLATSHSEKSQH